ncbi:hypothetical protein JOC74_000178 [Bacillus capparidis]|uniref:Uncharacterized protein n=1 Tax=Bacillus capparidis TaxID=1840411 RepID=A0ABS4CRP3_9BACI|nr:hypothetical protein [Bacillus capparidis]
MHRYQYLDPKIKTNGGKSIDYRVKHQKITIKKDEII